MSSSLRVVSLAALAAFLLSCGCGRSQQTVQLESNIKALTVAYGRFFQTNRGQPPANEEELKAFVAKMPPDALGLKDPASMWTSSRDKQPYVVVYGANPNPPGPSGPVVVYESKGVNGRRYVGTSLGNTEEVTEARFRELVPSASAAPSP